MARKKTTQSIAPEPEPEPTPVEIEVLEASLFEDAPAPMGIAPAPILAELTDDEKAEFVKLLNKEMPIRERASQLAKLARFSDQKRAAVGLRAIQEINALTGMSGAQSKEAPPMFALPPGTNVNIHVEKPKK